MDRNKNIYAAECGQRNAPGLDRRLRAHITCTVFYARRETRALADRAPDLRLILAQNARAEAPQPATKLLYYGASGVAWLPESASTAASAATQTLSRSSYRRQVTGHPCRPVLPLDAADGGPDAGTSDRRLRSRCGPGSDASAAARPVRSGSGDRARLRSRAYCRRHR